MIHLICPNPAIDRTILLETIDFNVPNRPIETREFPGGKSFNVAYALSYDDLEEEIVIHTMLGGLYGTHLANLAKERGYQVQATAVHKETRMCNILVDMSKKTIIPVYENGFSLDSDTLKQFTDALIRSIQNGDIIVFSGSLMKNMPDDYIVQLEKSLVAKQISAKLCVDTSGEALVQTYEQLTPYLIKINDEEIKALFPDKQLSTVDDYLKLLAEDIKKEIPNFIITLGKMGIVGRIEGELYVGAADPIEAKNPVACGDFFLGRLLKGIVAQQTAEEMLRSALLFSTCNAMTWYPEVSDQQMSELLPTITCQQVTLNGNH
ncbi:1-phosphofructokinase [Vagococcus sp. BWB3-3]|uniref:Tagatose-6-phosphate kinase n=1 Tax=Vagococcus allomyrinae TaxID=2794353 RepID=A0A940P426_9ENTE|nr:PfkB family carbohydrate kinase [Vagococcus allomyrinae]MBP1041062.1 1-phosphofructokinase [Vagococcus allomyrinae]